MSKKFYACVYGGASNTLDKSYIEEAEKLGEILAKNGFSLVYGAGASGCMGGVARGIKKNHGYVMGICPHFIESFEPMFPCDDTVMVDTMSERKALMEKHADVFIILPGGIGTMDEFFQVLTLKYLNQLETPIVVININHYYDSLIALLDDLVKNQAVVHGINTYFDVLDSVEDESFFKYLEEIKNKCGIKIFL